RREYRARLRERIQPATGKHLVIERVQSILEIGDDPEVAAATAHRPEEVGILLLARMQHFTVRGDDVHAEQVVAAQTEFAHEPALPAAKRETGDAGVGRGAERRGESHFLVRE